MVTKWNSALHPRNPIGQFREVGLTGLAHYTGRDGQIHEYYINNREALALGSQTLSMAAHGRVLSDASAHPADRIHVMGTDKGEMMEVAASERGTFGLINHDRTMPSETLSYARGSKFEKIGGPVRKDEQRMGGRPTKLVHGQGIPKYNTLNAQEAENANLKAFTDSNAKVYDIDPGEFGDRAADVRRWYEKEFGIGEAKARQMELYAYVDGRNNELHVTPAWTKDSDGHMKLRRSPNTHGGSPSVRLRGTDVTRMSRSMQDEGLEHVKFAISQGTRRTAGGYHTANALHFRTSFENQRTHEYTTFWGSVEQHNQGVHLASPEETGLNLRERLKRQDDAALRIAQQHWNPRNKQEAAALLRARHPRADVPSHRVHREKNGGVRMDYNGYSRHFDSHGDIRGVEIHDEKGLRHLLEQSGKQPKNATIAKTENGNWKVTSRPSNPNVRSSVTTYYDPHFNALERDDPEAPRRGFSRPAVPKD